MFLTITKRGWTAVVVVDGRLTITQGAEELYETVVRLVALDVRSIVLDLERLERLDAAGVGELVRLWVAVRKAGGRLGLLHLSPLHHEMLSVVGLLSVFQVLVGEHVPVSTKDAMTSREDDTARFHGTRLSSRRRVSRPGREGSTIVWSRSTI